MVSIKNKDKNSGQLVGNIGLYYVCYELSKCGWNVLPTSRNARGVDIVIYSQDAKETHTIQVKALSKNNPVPLGDKLDNLIADYFIICRNISSEKPDCFVAKTREIINLIHRGEKDGKISYWLKPKDYAKFKDRWDKIGDGR